MKKKYICVFIRLYSDISMKGNSRFPGSGFSGFIALAIILFLSTGEAARTDYILSLGPSIGMVSDDNSGGMAYSLEATLSLVDHGQGGAQIFWSIPSVFWASFGASYYDMERGMIAPYAEIGAWCGLNLGLGVSRPFGHEGDDAPAANIHFFAGIPLTTDINRMSYHVEPYYKYIRSYRNGSLENFGHEFGLLGKCNINL